jgi:hypothetical protein
MTVTVSKPAVNVREELSALKKPTGIKGEELLRSNNSSDVFKLINPTMMRNRVINGDMIVSQRYGDTAVSIVGNVYNAPYGYYTSANYAACIADKTFAADNTGVGNTGTAQRISISDANVPCQYALRFTRTSSASARTVFDSRFQHNIEGHLVQDVNETTPITISFYARASKSGRAVFQMWSDPGAGKYCMFPIQLTTGWNRYVFTVPGISVSSYNRSSSRGFGTGLYFANTFATIASGNTNYIWIAGNAIPGGGNVDDFGASGDWIDYTGLQLEISSTVTPLEVRPYNVELALCQRYCYVISGNAGDRVGQGWAYSTTSANISFNYPVTMRGNPSLSFCSPISYNDQIAGFTMGTPTLNASSTTFATIQATGGGGLTARAPGAAYFTNNSSLLVLTADV